MTFVIKGLPSDILSSKTEDERAPNSRLLFEWENKSADPIYVSTMLAWLEIPADTIIN